LKKDFAAWHRVHVFWEMEKKDGYERKQIRDMREKEEERENLKGLWVYLRAYMFNPEVSTMN